MNNQLKSYLARYVSLSSEEEKLFQTYLSPKSFKKKEFLLSEGQYCNSRYYIKKGCVRLFYFDQKGNEQIIHFAIDNWWISEYESLINKRPTIFYIQAIEDTELYEFSEDRFDELAQKIPQIERLFRKIMEKTYIAFQKRIEYFYSLNGEEQFQLFIAANPDFVQRVPQYMIASYLGMSPEFISKIKSKMV